MAHRARCFIDSGPIAAVAGKFGSEIVKLYGCAHYRNRGDTVCGNALRRPVEGVDNAVVEWIEANVLTENIIAAVLVEVRQRLAARTEAPSIERTELESEAKRLRGELDRLVAALASGTESPTIASGINDREKRLNEVRARLEVLRAAPVVISLEIRRLEREARARLADFPRPARPQRRRGTEGA